MIAKIYLMEDLERLVIQTYNGNINSYPLKDFQFGSYNPSNGRLEVKVKAKGMAMDTKQKEFADLPLLFALMNTNVHSMQTVE